jgi:hypothetical protein
MRDGKRTLAYLSLMNKKTEALGARNGGFKYTVKDSPSGSCQEESDLYGMKGNEKSGSSSTVSLCSPMISILRAVCPNSCAGVVVFTTMECPCHTSELSDPCHAQ